MTENQDFITQVERSMDIAVRYGVVEDNPIWASETQLEDIEETVDLNDPRLAKITRLRLLGDSDGWAYPYLDLSYCYGRLADGTHVRVTLPEYRFPKRGLKRALVQMCIDAGVHGKKLGMLDDNVISRLH